MESGKILADTSIIIEHLRINEKSESIFSRTVVNNEIYISSITIFELYCGATNNRKRNDIDILCKFANILNIDKETGQFAANLYLNLKDRGFSIGTEDLLIAANALQYNLSVLTLNKKHFNKVENLKLI